MSFARTLDNQALFAALPQEMQHFPAALQDRVFAASKIHWLKKDETLLEIGQVAPPVYLVLSGLLTVFMKGSGGANVAVDFLKQHRWMAAGIYSRDMSFCQISAANSAVVVSWPLPFIFELFQRDASFTSWFSSCTVSRIQLHYQKIAMESSWGLQARLARLYWELGTEESGATERIVPKIPQKDIASYFGVRREEVNRKQILLKKAGYLNWTHDNIYVSPTVLGLFSL